MKNKAFTLVETLIAITFMTVVMTAITGLILSTLHAHERNVHELQALAFAQEGLEVVRFVRDSNGLQNFEWSRGFDLEDLEEKTFYVKKENCPPCFVLSSSEKDAEVRSASGFPFQRSILVSAFEGNEEALEITAQVKWRDKQIERSVELSTLLSNWR